MMYLQFLKIKILVLSKYIMYIPYVDFWFRVQMFIRKQILLDR